MVNHLLQEIIWSLPIGRYKWRLLAALGLSLPRRVVIAEINDRYLRNFGRLPDLDNPVTWSEKIQWLKLNYRNSLLPVAADKYRVREHIRSRGLGHILTNLLGVYENADDIDFDALPDQFVLKVNHDSGGVIIVTDKHSIDEKEIRKRLKRIMRKPYTGGVKMGEWHYLYIPRRILVEEYLGDMLESASEYRLHCMNGAVKFISAATLADGQRVSRLYDSDWQPIAAGLKFPRFDQEMPKPAMLDDMLDIAHMLADELPYVRVDLFQFDDCVRFGELTFFPDAGFAVLEPREWDHTFGSWLRLPDKQC